MTDGEKITLLIGVGIGALSFATVLTLIIHIGGL